MQSAADSVEEYLDWAARGPTRSDQHRCAT